jgi:hypothetical protein
MCGKVMSPHVERDDGELRHEKGLGGWQGVGLWEQTLGQ